MLTRRNVLVGMVCSVAALLGGVSVARAADNATGTWKWQVTRQDNKIDLTLKLKQEGDKVTGTLSGMGNQEVAIKDGTVKDGTISFAVTRKGRDDQEWTSKYSGKIEGDTIKGKIDTERNGETRSRDWEAKRSKE
jgi:hypothetical protein